MPSSDKSGSHEKTFNTSGSYEPCSELLGIYERGIELVMQRRFNISITSLKYRPTAHSDNWRDCPIVSAATKLQIISFVACIEMS